MPPYRRRFVKKRTYRSRSSSKYRRPTLLKRLRTRAYANLRTGGLLAIERKFSDLSCQPVGLTNGGSGEASGDPSIFAPGLKAPTIYRSAIGTIIAPLPATFTALNVLGTGDSGSDRDGRQVINDSIHIRGHCYIGGTVALSTSPNVVVNIVLVLDTQTNGAGPTGGQVFVNPGDYTGQGAATGCSPFVNLANSKRFRILKHIRRIIAPPSAWLALAGGAINSTTGGFTFAMDIPLKGMKTNYVADGAIAADGTAGAATTASIGDNGIFLFAWSNTAANGAAITYNSRLRFRG